MMGDGFLVDEDYNRLRSRVRHMRYTCEGNCPNLCAHDIHAGRDWEGCEGLFWMVHYMRERSPPVMHWNQGGISARGRLSAAGFRTLLENHRHPVGVGAHAVVVHGVANEARAK